MVDPLRRLIGKEVTIIDRRYSYGSVGILQSVGSKNLKLSEVGNLDVGHFFIYGYEREHCIVIEGQRPDVLAALQAAMDAGRKAQEQRDHDKRQDIGRFESEWIKTHPMPRAPKLEEVLSQLDVAIVQEAQP